MDGTDDLRALVARAQSHDADAWEALYRRAYPRLMSYARRRLSTTEAADDAVSEAIARAVDRIDRFEWRGAGFDGWMYGILRNVILEAHRVRPLLAAELPDPPSPDHGPLDRLVADENAAAVRRAFSRLGRDDQELLELRLVGELDANAVGAVLGKRPGAVRMAQSRALARLRGLMKEEAAGRGR